MAWVKATALAVAMALATGLSKEEDTNTYETQVRGQVKKGRAIIAGFADGANKKGISREDLKQAIQGALSEESDPTENQTLPRTEREHAQQYFDQLREGT